MFQLSGSVTSIEPLASDFIGTIDLAVGDPVAYTFMYDTANGFIGFDGYIGDDFFSVPLFASHTFVTTTPGSSTGEVFLERHNGISAIGSGFAGTSNQYELYAYQQRVAYEGSLLPPGPGGFFNVADFPTQLTGANSTMYFFPGCAGCAPSGSIRVTTPSIQQIPEPSGLLLMLLGGATVSGLRMRARRQQGR
jgi:hypothetical protein